MVCTDELDNQEDPDALREIGMVTDCECDRRAGKVEYRLLAEGLIAVSAMYICRNAVVV